MWNGLSVGTVICRAICLKWFEDSLAEYADGLS